jgi:bifunctional oligoribonuclease and PAP phosphatase NrnA
MTLEIAHACSANREFLIAGHVRPDGDVFGSQLALALSLQQIGKNVTVWNADGITPIFKFLPGSHLISKPTGSRSFDIVITVDTATYERLGSVREFIASRKLLINVDHHGTNPHYGDINWIDDRASATGEIIYRLLRANNWPLTPDIASNLFVAISTDTGSFQYSNTTPECFRTAADLIELGADVSALSQQCYQNFPLARFRLLAAIFSNLEFASNGRIGMFWITPEMYATAGAAKEDSEGLIDYVRSINTVIVAVLFEQLAGERVKISLRSKLATIEVNTIAQLFGGGGHKSAAAATLVGTARVVQDKVVSAITDALVAAGMN